MAVQKHSERKSPSINTAKVIKKSSRSQTGRWLWFWAGLTGVAMVSATAGALLAVSLSSTPLMQAELSPEQEAIFGGKGDRISRGSLKLSELTRPVNILVLGVKVLTSDVSNPPTGSDKLGYHATIRCKGTTKQLNISPKASIYMKLRFILI